MRIRQVNLLDLEEIVRIEQVNFLGEEATSPEKLKNKLKRFQILFNAGLNGETLATLIGLFNITSQRLPSKKE